MLKIGGQKVPTALVLLVATDCVLITLGLFLATVVRFSFGARSSIVYYLASWQSIWRFVLAVLVWGPSLYFNDLHDFGVIASRRELLVRLTQPFGLPCIALAICVPVASDIAFGRRFDV